jgi:hypothetical protein
MGCRGQGGGYMLYFAIAFSFVLLTVFEFSFISLHSLYLLEILGLKGEC